MDPEIRDQAYQFFIEEAPELLDVLETGLLNLQQDSSTAQLHELMRAAHSIKGGAASVELNSLKTLAHRLETIFKALYGDQVEVSRELESQLLLAYDCLREPLIAQIETGHHDGEQALETAEPVLSALEAELGPALEKADSFIPSASDLGIDMVASMFEIDVQQGIERLQSSLEQASADAQRGELLAQAEVFSGFAELFNLPGFGEICTAAVQASQAQSSNIATILQQTIEDLISARCAVLDGDRKEGGKPSTALLAMAAGNTDSALEADFLSPAVAAEPDVEFNVDDLISASLEDGLETSVNPSDLLEADFPATDLLEDVFAVTDLDDGMAVTPEIKDSVTAYETDFSETDLLEDVFEVTDLDERIAVTPETALSETDLSETDLLEDVFAATDLDEPTVASDAELLGNLDGILADTTATTTEAATPDWTLNGWDDSPKDLPSHAREGDSRDDGFDLDLDEALMGSALAPNDAPVFDSTELLDAPAIPPPPESITAAIDTLADNFDALPVAKVLPAPSAKATSEAPRKATQKPAKPVTVTTPIKPPGTPTQTLTARIALQRLERMDNLVGELAINRNGLSLQNEQFQRTVRSLKQRFGQFRSLARQLQTLSDKILVAPEQFSGRAAEPKTSTSGTSPTTADALGQFDTLQMDSYGAVNVLLEDLLEEVLQVEETIEDVQLFSGQSNRKLDQQRQLLTQLRDELMWSRMVPLSGVLNRFPRILRELSTAQDKPATLKLVGTDVLVDRVVLEKLYDPLLHLLRNAFDHGLESSSARIQQGKPETGTITIRAYRRGNSIFMEMRDDGQGLDTEKIGQRAIAAGLITSDGLAVARPQQIYNLIFEPGFSTADQISDVSGRGMGMDIVRSRLQALNGKVTLTTEPGQGTTFTLRIPLTLTLSKLVIAEAGPSIVALAADSIEEILIPTEGQLKTSAGQRFLIWRDQVVPIHNLTDWLPYSCPMSQQTSPVAAATATMAGRYQAKKPLLILQQGQSPLALEIDQVLTEQELVIKPFGNAIAPPSYINGCTVLGDGQLVPVIDGTSVVGYSAASRPAASLLPPASPTAPVSQTATVLIVDDSSAMRRTLALTLQKAGYRVEQARDGREALDQLQQGQRPQLIVCDVEMPRMNGFEFLSQRRLQSHLAAIPTLMLTSRSSQKHRQLALQLGATAYFTKPYIEAEFLQTLRHYLTAVPAATR